MAQMNYLRNFTRSFQAHLRCSQRLFATTPVISADEKKIITSKRPFNTSVKRTDENGLEKVSFKEHIFHLNFFCELQSLICHLKKANRSSKSHQQRKYRHDRVVEGLFGPS